MEEPQSPGDEPAQDAPAGADQARTSAAASAGPPPLVMGLVAVGTTLLVAAMGAGAWMVLRKPPPPPPVAQVPPPVVGPWEPYALDEAALAAQKAANDNAGAGLPTVAGNKVPADLAGWSNEPGAPLVKLTIPGHGGADQPPAPVMRLPTAAAFARAAARMKDAHDLQPRVLRAWMSRAELARLEERFPSLAALPLTTGFLADGMDLSRVDAAGQKPLTLDRDGKVILLAELETEEGRRRFEGVVKVILADAIKAQPGEEARLVAGWVKSAEADWRNGVWGLHEAMMEVLAEQGLGSGHCGGAPQRAWHVEPLHGAPPCKRFDATWVERITDYRASPGPSEEHVARALAMAAEGKLQPYLLEEEERNVNDAVNLGLPDDFALVSFNRVSPRVSRNVEDADGVLVWLDLPGKDRAGNTLRVLGRARTVELVKKVAEEVQEKFNLGIRPNFLWRSNARQHQLRTATPRLAALPGQSNHAVDAADISRVEASGKAVLTLGVDGLPIFLSELELPPWPQAF